MIESRWLLLGLIVPAVLAAMPLLLTAWRCRSRGTGAVSAAWSVALGAGWVAGHIATHGRPHEPWNSGENWLLLTGVAASLLSLMPDTRWALRLTQSSLRVLLLAGICTAMMQPAIRYVWPWWLSVVWVGATTLVATVVIELAAPLGRGRTGRAAPIALAITAIATGIVCMMSGSFTIGQFALVLGAVIAGGGVAALLLPGESAASGLIGAAMPTLLAVLLFGTHGADVHMRLAILLFAAPLTMWVGELPPLRRIHRPWLRGIVHVVCVLIPLAIAIAIVVPQFIEDMRSPYPAY